MAKIFVKAVVYDVSDVAVFRHESVLWIVDGSHLHAREIIRLARGYGGEVL